MPKTVVYELRERLKPSLLARMLGLAKRSSWSGPWASGDKALAAALGTGPRSDAGIAVTNESALTFSAVWDAVNIISADVSKLPLNLHKRNQGGGSDHYVDSKLYRLLKDEPNPEMGSMVFRRTLQAHALTGTGGYAEIERDGAGRPIALWILTPDRVRPYREEIRTSGKTTLGGLRYEIDGGPTSLPASDVIHIHGLGYDGYCGYDLITKARQAIGLALGAERFGSSFFANGSTFGGIVSMAGDLDEDQKNDVREAIETLHRSADRAHRLLVLGNDAKFTSTGVTPEQSQMNELRNRQVEEVARFYRMPPYMLGVNTPGTVSYASVEMAKLDYYTGCLLDWITIWEQELNRKLISPLEARLQFFKHNANAFLRGDIKSRYDALGVARDKGIINADEWRDLEEMNPQPNGQGKLYLVQSAMVPADRLADLVDAQITAKKTPRPQDHGQQIKTLKERAEAAEALAAEARREAQTERDRRVALEATGTATAEELSRVQASERELVARATQLQLLADGCRTQADTLTEQQEAIVAELAVATTARSDAERLATDAIARAELAEQARDRSITDVVAADDRARLAGIERDAAIQRALEAERVAATATTDLATSAAARDQAQQLAVDAQAVAEAREAQRVEAVRIADEATTVATAARAEAEQLLADALARADVAEARAVAAEATAGAHQTESERLRSAASDSERDRDAARAQAAAAETRAIGEAEARAAADTAVQTHRRAELARLTDTLTAHRGLIVDAMGRMVRREAEKARRHQATPEKLRAWIDAFYVTHEDTCVEALLPAVRVHLAWTQSADDVDTVTRALVREHIRESARQLRAAAHDPEDLHASLERMLQRWEADRPAALADRILREEIEHVRTYRA